MDTRERVARLLFADYVDGTGYNWHGTLDAEREYRGRAYKKADSILAIFAEEREALQERIDELVAREAKLREALAVACRLMGHADIDWPESIDAALATVKEGK